MATKSIFKNCTCVRYGLILLLFTLLTFKSSAQDIDYSFYGKYMYHFTKYINWPESKRNGDFVVVIVGQSTANKAIKDVFNGKKVGAQTIVVKEMQPTADFTGVSMIFLSSGSSSQLSAVSPKASSVKALLVTEKGGLAKKGGDISFFIQDEKLKFELNKAVIENKGLKIATELLRLAVVIN